MNSSKHNGLMVGWLYGFYEWINWLVDGWMTGGWIDK